MAGSGIVYGAGGDAMYQTKKLKISPRDLPLDSIFGSGAMLSFGAVGDVRKSGNLFYPSFEQDENGDQYLDDYFNQREKKSRLSVDQVQFLERSFELENKLEPERKSQLAKELGLQPRQIAVWFQNRRARWKTKQLETDYETLHASYKSLKNDYDNLLKENEKLKVQVLPNNGLAEDIEKGNLMSEEAVSDIASEDEESKVSEVSLKNEVQRSGNGYVRNEDSPWLTNAIHSSFLQSGDSLHVPEHGRSDLSQNGGDDFYEELLEPACIFPENEADCCHLPATSSSYFGFPAEDQAIGFWSY